MTYSGRETRSILYLTEFSIDLCFFLQEMAACAMDDAYAPVW